MKTRFCCLLVLSLPFSLSAQSFSGDSILASERSIDRPVTLHARQIRITGGYGLSLISRRFDNNSEIVELKDEGLSSVRHRFSLDVKYGINDIVQINVAIAGSGNVVREETKYIVPEEPEPVVAQDIITNHSGLEDLYVAVDLRAPLKTRRLDVAATFGITLPVATFNPSLPGHTFEATEENGQAVNKYVYRYNRRLGKGVAVGQLGAMLKYRTPRWAFSGRLDYMHGLKDGESYEWRHQLNDDGKFDYRQDAFRYRLPDAYSYYVEAEYQPRSWLDLLLNVSGLTAFNGWTASQDDFKVATPYQTTLIVSPGFEIIVTPRFWVRETLYFPVAGKSYEAPFASQTSIIYNFFPFK